MQLTTDAYRADRFAMKVFATNIDFALIRKIWSNEYSRVLGGVREASQAACELDDQAGRR